MINLKEALSGFKEKYGRNIEYNAQDQVFYEGRQPIRFETPAEADIEKAKANQVDFKIGLNEAYESRLSPADKDLRKIIIKQTELEICREL